MSVFSEIDERALADALEQAMAETNARLERRYREAHPVRAWWRRLHSRICWHEHAPSTWSV